MGKQLTVKDSQGKTYTLEYSRRTVQIIESRGFVASEIESKPATMLPLIIEGAFLMHHRGISAKTVDSIYAGITDKDAFIGALAEMYAEPLEALLDEPKGDKSKNASWTKSW